MDGKIYANMIPDNVRTVIHVSQYDTERLIKVVLILDNRDYEIPEGAEIVIQGVKPSSGLGFTVYGVIEEDGVVFSTTEAMTAEYGQIPCEIVVTKDGLKLGSANMTLDVEKSPHPTGTTDGTREEIIDEITIIMQEAREAAVDALQAEEAALDARDAAQEYAQSASDDADRAERAADRAEGVAGISLIGDVTWADNGFNTTGSVYEDIITKANRAVTAYAFPCILSLTATADSAVAAWVKLYDKDGKYYRLDGITINRMGTTYTVDPAAKFIRISVAANGKAGAEALNIKVSLRQDLSAMEDLFNRATIETIKEKPIPAPFTMGTINQISRLGWKTSAGGFPPVQSLPGYAMAYDNKVRIMLCDVRLTADGEYVCWHDENLSSLQIRHPDGTALSAAEKAQQIVNLTGEQIDQYDFGIYKGEQYAGLKMLRLEEFLKWCADMNCWAVLEMKVQLTTAQIAEMSMIIKRHKMGERTMIAIQYVHADTPAEDPGYIRYMENLPKASFIIFGGQTRWDRTVDICEAIAEAGKTVYIGHTHPEDMTQAMIDEVRAEGIGIVNATDIDSEAALQALYDNGYIDYYDMISSAWVQIPDYVYKRRMEE